jgi:hypothetical protein
MALKAGYVGVKSWLYEKLQVTTSKNVQDIADIIDHEEATGVKNLLDVTAATQEKGGLTFTVNADKSITISAGTSTSSIYLNLDYVNNSDLTSKNITAFVGKKLKGVISPSNVGVGLAIGYFKGDNTYVDRITSDYIYTSGAFEYPSAAVRTKNFLYIANNTTFANDTTIYPMITFEDMSSDFAPFAMTNQQLTGSADDQKTTINAIITAATGAADFAAFKTAMAALTPLTRSAALDTREASPEVVEDPEPVTRKSTKKTTTKEGE